MRGNGWQINVAGEQAVVIQHKYYRARGPQRFASATDGGTNWHVGRESDKQKEGQTLSSEHDKDQLE